MSPFANFFRYLETLRRGDFLTEEKVLNLCNKAKEILIEESNVQRVDTPVTVKRVLIEFLILFFCSCVGIFTDSFTIFWNCFGSAGNVQMLITCSWEILWIVVSTVLRPYYY